MSNNNPSKESNDKNPRQTPKTTSSNNENTRVPKPKVNSSSNEAIKSYDPAKQK